jgi:spermidine synthase
LGQADLTPRMENRIILLEDVETPFGRIRITRSERTGNTSYHQDKCLHSQADIDGVSTCVYIHVMHEIIRQCRGKRVLIIGGAGGTLATMLTRHNYTVTLVDINDYAFTIAKRYFQLPDTVECVVADGLDYLRRMQKSFDAIAIDVFESQKKGRIPEAFLTDEFFCTLKAALKPCGMAVMNVMTGHDLDRQPIDVACGMEKAGMPAKLFDWQGVKNRNTLVACGDVEETKIPTGNEPFWIKPELKGISWRHVKRT